MNVQISRDENKFAAPRRTAISARTVILMLSACMALQTTGLVMILPLFARRFAEFGAGVEQLSASVMAGALAGALAAPLLGALADRIGRRRMLLFSLLAYSLVFAGYLFAASAALFILLRALSGALTAGLVPAVLGMVADLSPADRRAQWVGFVSGGASFGWMAGPLLGGVFYDRWGYSAAVAAALVMALVTLLIAYLVAPDIRPAAQPNLSLRRPNPASAWRSMRAALSHPPATLLHVLWISFAVMFAWALIEPSFMFYAYEDLHWNSTMLGLVMSTYGIAMLAGEFGLSRLSDRVGRKPVILLGLVLFAAQFIGLAFFRHYGWISASFIIAGLGNALYDPALSAAVIDITAPQHQARIQGLKSMAASLGAILGPALAVALIPTFNARAVFLAAIAIVAITTFTTLFAPAARPAEH